jgi:hypothetical protein
VRTSPAAQELAALWKADPALKVKFNALAAKEKTNGALRCQLLALFR